MITHSDYIPISTRGAHLAAKHMASIHGTTPILPVEKVTLEGVKINLWAKLENVQELYNFKTRGAEWFTHLLMRAPNKQRLKPTLVTASAGNHAQGVALAAKRYGLESVIFMPHTTPEVKINGVKNLGAKIFLEGNTFNDTLPIAQKFTIENTRRFFVHPYENSHIMEGQASIAVELLSQIFFHPNYLHIAKNFPDSHLPHAILCPVGGGGLVSGIGAVCKEFFEKTGHKIYVIGVQTEAADSMYKSFKENKVIPSSKPFAPTIADGINVKLASERMIPTLRNYVDKVVLVEEEKIKRGIAYFSQHPHLKKIEWPGNVLEADVLNQQDRKKLIRDMSVLEGAAAASYVAAYFGDKYGELDWQMISRGKNEINVYCITSGANINPEVHRNLISMVQRPLELKS